MLWLVTFWITGKMATRWLPPSGLMLAEAGYKSSQHTHLVLSVVREG